MEYLTDKGEIASVTSGISNGRVWMSVTQKQKPGSGTHRIVSKNLPLRESKMDAEIDLARYAAIKGWRYYKPTTSPLAGEGRVRG
jgi:hypothetical protein